MLLSKIFFLLIVLLSACAGAYFIDPELVTTDILSAVCTIFSVLAGLVLAIYALHISSIESAGSKPVSIANSVMWDSKKSVSRLSYFFWLYLIVLSCSLIVIVGNSVPNRSGLFAEIHTYSIRATIFFSIAAMGMSFLIPLELKYIQERKILESKKSQ